jgi:YHS domain-containing protein
MESEALMDYQWCHGPSCHKRHTTNRVRGVKGSKVLRTIKIAQGNQNARGVWNYFCDQTCMHDFIYKHVEQFVQLHPRTEALETPIEDPTKNPYGWIQIKEVDNRTEIE